jgi:hypothetical protein
MYPILLLFIHHHHHHSGYPGNRDPDVGTSSSSSGEGRGGNDNSSAHSSIDMDGLDYEGKYAYMCIEYDNLDTYVYVLHK